MNTILENVFLHDNVRGGKAIGFHTPGMWPVGQGVGYIVKDKTLGAVYAASACGPMPLLTPSHLRAIAKRLNHLNEQA